MLNGLLGNGVKWVAKWVQPGVGAVVRAVAWDPIGPEFKPRWDTELIYMYVCVYIYVYIQ